MKNFALILKIDGEERTIQIGSFKQVLFKAEQYLLQGTAVTIIPCGR